MRFIRSLGSSVALASLLCLPLFAANAKGMKIVAKCDFPSAAQEQGEDCSAKIIYCINHDQTHPKPQPDAVPSPMGHHHHCHKYMKTTCGETTIFRGRYNFVKGDTDIWVTGTPSMTYPSPVTVYHQIPEHDHGLLPAVEGAMYYGDLARKGTCEFKIVRPGPNPHPTPEPLPTPQPLPQE